MKFLTIAVLFSLSTSVFAQAPQASNEMFTQVKQQALSNIEKRMGYLNELKSCVSAASNHDAIKACRATHKSEMASLKSENASFKSGIKSQREAKRAAKKQQ